MAKSTEKSWSLTTYSKFSAICCFGASMLHPNSDLVLLDILKSVQFRFFDLHNCKKLSQSTQSRRCNLTSFFSFFFLYLKGTYWNAPWCTVMHRDAPWCTEKHRDAPRWLYFFYNNFCIAPSATKLIFVALLSSYLHRDAPRCTVMHRVAPWCTEMALFLL